MRPTRRQIIWLAAGVVLLALSVASVGYSLLTLHRTPWTGMQFNPDLEPGVTAPRLMLVVPTMKPGGVMQLVVGTPADIAGIRLNDRILRVNGIPTHDLAALRRLTGTLKVGDEITCRVERLGNTFDVAMRLDSPLDSPGFKVGLASGAVLAVVFAVIGLIVYMKRLHDRRARLFYVISVLFAVAYLNISGFTSGSMSGTGINDVQSMGLWMWILAGLYILFASLLGALLLHFSMIFPRVRPVVDRHPGTFGWIYGVPVLHIVIVLLAILLKELMNAAPEGWDPGPALLAIFTFATGVIIWTVVKAARLAGWKAAVLARPVRGMTVIVLLPFITLWVAELAWKIGTFPEEYEGLLFLVVIALFVTLIAVTGLLVWPIATSVVLYRSLRESGPEERAQVRWPVWGTIFSLIGVTALGLLSFALTFSHGSSAQVYVVAVDLLQKAFYLLIPLSFSVAILKYRLMDIELILRKTAIYSMVTGTVLVLYMVLAWGLGGLLVRMAEIESKWVIIASALVMGAVLVPLRNRAQTFVDRRFFRKRLDYPQAIGAIAEGLKEAADAREVANVIAEQVQQAVRSRAVVIFLRRGSGTVLHATAKIGLPDDALDQLRITGDRSLLERGRPIEILSDADMPDDLRRTLRQARTSLLVPIHRRGELYGAMSVGAKLSGNTFDDEDQEFCTSVADHAGVALENMLLRRAGEEVDSALEIQRHLLPKEIPRLEGFEISASWLPSRTVAGDYYDVLRIGRGRIGICIADATGKGMPAALMMSNLQAAVRALAPGSTSPAALCASLNQILSESVAMGKFITFFYAELDSDAKTLHYTNAGHNPPIVLRRDGRVERLTEGGMVLGAFSDREYEDREIDLAEGDRILLFTDGITEALNRDGEEFGEDRLLKVMRDCHDGGARKLEEAIITAVNVHCPGEMIDDATLLVIAVEPGN